MNLDFTKLDGLLPAVVQDNTTGRVLMVGFMNEAAWKKTRETGNVTFFSRTRNKLWMKGESSGHVLKVREIATDCDQDTLLIKADNLGPGVCHNGFESCFYRRLEDGNWVEIEKPVYDPNAVYGGSR
ncbi:MAG: phosphoribosyl-AMP cyclohydrolase [Acidobacteriota bacterium]|nr:phosphoribosyl-AMP cyclohydrolase [Acidobacteriota bacterium]